MAPPPLLPLLLAVLSSLQCALSFCSADRVARTVKSLGDTFTSTACPATVWKRDFFQSDTIQSASHPITIIDIGCNKGFDALATYKLFTQNFSVTHSAWMQHTGFSCGTCGQCHGMDEVERNYSGQPVARPVDLFCIEPLPANYNRVKKAADHFGLTSQGFHTILAAMSSPADVARQNGTTRFLADEPRWAGGEGSAIGKVPRKCLGKHNCAFVHVPITHLDALLGERNVTSVDILSIDAEGYDPLVLAGSERTLSNTRYVEFEVHVKGPWKATRRQDVFNMLEHKGFICYWIGNAKVWRVTGCWDESYSGGSWGNVGCVHHSESAWLATMEHLFNLTVPEETIA